MSRTQIGIIGAGWWAVQNHIPVFQSMPNVEVRAICGVNRDHLTAIQDRYGISFATEDYEELLAMQDLDGVVVSSPHNLHHCHAMSSLRAGMPVLCEKPMALNSGEAAGLVDLVNATGLPFMVPYGWNYTDMAKSAREAIESGLIGEVEHVLCHMGSPLRDLLSGSGAWVAEGSLFKPQPDTWSHPEGGGGFAHGQLTHALALMLWITQLQPSEVFAFANNSDSRSELSMSLSCRFTNGATGSIGGTGTIPPQSPFQVDVRIYGSKGMVMLDVERPRIEIHTNDGHTRSLTTAQQPGSYVCVEPLKTFIGLLREEPVENRSPVWLGKRVVDVLDAALRSVKTRKAEVVG